MIYRLLVVDDEPNLLRAVAACLYREEYEVSTARNADQALVRIAQTLPDVIISDIRMPGLDGYGLLRHLRGSRRTALIPVVFLSAKDQCSDRVEGFRAGVDAYLTKPFEPDELLAIIGGILARVRRTHTEIARLVGSAANGMVGEDEDLTPGELRIAAGVARGLSNREIATELGLSIRTVENHISHILRKKEFGNRVEIARLMLRTGPGDSTESERPA
jgi:DNA-binding NarL/FixJ family response regulator